MIENAIEKERLHNEQRQSVEFSAGDLAVYPAHGVGRIESIESREVNGIKQDFYIMNIIENNMVIMIPIQNARSVCLRNVIQEEEVPKIYDVLRQKGPVFVNHMNWNRRYKEYMDKIKTGSLSDVAEVFRDLFRVKYIKELSFGERKLLDISQSLLLNELCVVMNSDERRIMRKIKKLIEENIDVGNA